jgi:hypothetical protein
MNTPARPWNTPARPENTLARNIPDPAAHAHGNDFVTDWPVQGPTDPGMRQADCNFVKQNYPVRLPCVDCGDGAIPLWAQVNRMDAKISRGGGVVQGFAVGADPYVQVGGTDPGPFWSTTLTTAQQTWVMNTLVKLDQLIRTTTATYCPTFGPSIIAAGKCFQNWFNAAKLGMTKPDGSPVVLRTDGVFDQDTLNALITVAGMNPKDFPNPYPGTAVEKKGLSTGAMIGIGAGVVAVGGTVVYLITRKK